MKHHFIARIFLTFFILLLPLTALSTPDSMRWVDCSGDAIGVKELKTIDGSLKVEDSNIKQVVYFIKNSYINFLNEIFTANRKYKDMPKKYFILWRNKEFQPAVDQHRGVFEDILKKNRTYLYEKGGPDLTSIFGSMFDITMIGLDTMYAIRDNNKTKSASAMKKIKETNLEFKRVFDSLSLCKKAD